MKVLILTLLLLPSLALSQTYNRPDWRHWLDFDYDCQDARQETLIVHSVTPVSFSADGCRVLTGVWNLPYSGVSSESVRSIHIDHVIPLKYAHDAGGHSWSPVLKKLFANDPGNLLPVSGVANIVKGAKGPSEFMPVEAFRCEYARRWQMLSRKYELVLKGQDLDVIRSVLRGCN